MLLKNVVTSNTVNDTIRNVQQRTICILCCFFIIADLKAQLNIRNAEISELRIQLDDVKKAQQREQLARDDLHASYQQRLREKQAEIEAFKRFVSLPPVVFCCSISSLVRRYPCFAYFLQPPIMR